MVYYGCELYCDNKDLIFAKIMKYLSTCYYNPWNLIKGREIYKLEFRTILILTLAVYFIKLFQKIGATIVDLFLSTTPFFNLQINDSPGPNIVISQSIGVLKEHCVHLEFLFSCGHSSFFVQFCFNYSNLV